MGKTFDQRLNLILIRESFLYRFAAIDKGNKQLAQDQVNMADELQQVNPIDIFLPMLILFYAAFRHHGG